MRPDRTSTSEKQRLISSFLEIASGQTQETARQFLQVTGWKLEEALQLFYVGGEVGWANGLSLPAAAEEGGVRVEDEDVGDRPAAIKEIEEKEVRAPLPVKRDILYDDAGYYRFSPSPVIAFRDFEEEAKQSGIWETDQNAASSSRDNLASLYRPPFALMHNGPFDKAKVEASLQDKWLLVNLQSSQEFSSHMLNRDTWSNEAVEQTIRSNFIFWQVYNDTSEGKRVCTYYNLVSVPAVLVIDPITGQQMRTWSGMIHPERLLEDLLPYLDGGPKEHHAPRPRKRPRESSQMLPSTADKVSEEQIRSAIESTSLDDKKKQKVATCFKEPALAELDTRKGSNKKDIINIEESNTEKVSDDGVAVARHTYPPLPDEPHGDGTILCRVAIKLPDGRRLQRNFLLTDPVQLLWSFCCVHLEEGRTRPFSFTHAIPHEPNRLRFESHFTFAEAGISNSMILFTWE